MQRQIPKLAARIAPFILLFLSSAYPVSYYYDDAGRLAQVAYDDGKGVAYTYDDNDNLLTQTPLALPLPPQSLMAVENPDIGITVEWDASDGATGFKLYRKSDRNSVWVELADLPSGTLAFIDTDYIGGLKYSYRVAATNADGQSAYSSATAQVGLVGSSVSVRLYLDNPNARLLQIVFSTQPGYDYQIESSSTLQPDSWSPAPFATDPAAAPATGTIPATTESYTAYLPISLDSGPPRFYRIIRQP